MLFLLEPSKDLPSSLRRKAKVPTVAHQTLCPASLFQTLWLHFVLLSPPVHIVLATLASLLSSNTAANFCYQAKHLLFHLPRHSPPRYPQGQSPHLLQAITHIITFSMKGTLLQFSSVQFSLSVVSDSLQPHELQHSRRPCPSPTPGVHSDSRPSSQWCHPAIPCRPLLLLPPIPPSIRVFSNESTLRMRWPKY